MSHGRGPGRRPPAWFLALAACAPGAAAAGEVRCFSNARWHVVSREHDEGVGATVAVTALKGAAAPRACTFDRAKADYVLFGEGADPPPLYPQALEGDHLVVDEGTGTERGLVVFDLRDRRRILAVPSNAFAARDGKVVYWERVGDAKRADCPRDFDRIRKDGLTPKLTLERELTLAGGGVARLPGRRCEEGE